MAQPIILLIEDNPDDIVLTLRAFKQNQFAYDVAVVQDGPEALEWLRGTGAHAGRDPRQLPTIILLDLNLQRSSGLEVLRAIRSDERTRLVRVVVLTTSREERDVIESYRLGANSYIRKPVDLDEFTTLIGQLGLYWLVLNERVPAPR